MSTTIKLRRGLSTAFSTNNPTLQAGEPAFETDTGKLKIGDGTTLYNNLGYIGDGLKNNSTSGGSLAILGTTSGINSTVIGSDANSSNQGTCTIIGASSRATSGTGNIVVGYNSRANSANGVVIGNNRAISSSSNAITIGNNGSMSGSNQGVSIGYGAGCVSASHGVAIGYNAEARSSNAIQLGEGTNNTSSTLQFGSYQLVNSSGKIPNDRLNIDSTPTSASSNTVSSDGVYTALSSKADSATTLSGYGITDGADTDLSNVTDDANILMSGMGMPGSTLTELTLGATATEYIAPSNGYFRLNGYTSGFCYLRNLDSEITMGLDREGIFRLYVPIIKGHRIRVDYSGTMSDILFAFIYAQGSESEYVAPSGS